MFVATHKFLKYVFNYAWRRVNLKRNQNLNFYKILTIMCFLYFYIFNTSIFNYLRASKVFDINKGEDMCEVPHILLDSLLRLE